MAMYMYMYVMYTPITTTTQLKNRIGRFVILDVLDNVLHCSTFVLKVAICNQSRFSMLWLPMSIPSYLYSATNEAYLLHGIQLKSRSLPMRNTGT